LEDFIPPIREKRRFVFEEEADEFHLDLAWGGADVYMSRFTKRDEIPGLAIEAEIGMSGGTSAYILNAYFTWICRVAFAVESAGIDTEITLQNHVVRLYSEKSNQETMTVVKVKKENEQSDFLSWSAMLSPASLRGLMFIAKTLRCDREGINANSSMGGRVDGRGGWSVKFDPFTRTMKFSTPFDPDGFPEAQMTRELREALKSATQMG
jgi:hypothetical protein